MTGTPMVAASPERHDGGIQANPVEVQSYQPPWKVLSDFALQSDIEQPSFQQLVCFVPITGYTGVIYSDSQNITCATFSVTYSVKSATTSSPQRTAVRLLLNIFTL